MIPEFAETDSVSVFITWLILTGIQKQRVSCFAVILFSMLSSTVAFV